MSIFHGSANAVYRPLMALGVLLNAGVAASSAVFVFAPGAALGAYELVAQRPANSFVYDLQFPAQGDSWFLVFLAVNAVWLLPLFVLSAVSFIYVGVRPDLAGQGIVSLGRDTAQRTDDSTAWFGITNGALFGIAMLAILALSAATALSSKEFAEYAHKSSWKTPAMSVKGALEGYRNLVRGALGTAPPPAPSPASAPKQR